MVTWPSTASEEPVEVRIGDTEAMWEEGEAVKTAPQRLVAKGIREELSLDGV